MTWQVVARRELRVLRGNNTLTIFVAFFALLAAAISYGATNGDAESPLAEVLSLLFMFAVPLTAGSLVHEAVPNAVRSGRIRHTLSLPHTRTEFLAGVGASRVAGLLASVGAALVAGAAVHLFRGGPVSLLDVVTTLAVGTLLGAAFVAVTLALTARLSSASFAAVATYGFFLLSLAWPVVVGIGKVVLAAQFGVFIDAITVDTLVQLSPIYAYQNTLVAVGVNASGTAGYIPAWGGGVVLLAWTVGGFALAARRFSARDL